jgi:hypothetical protein
MKSREELLRIFTVDDKGYLYRAGREVTGKNGCGYKTAEIDGKRLYVHRIVYQMTHGDLLPEDVIDHIDGNPLNNHPDNLRKGSQADNTRNMKHHRDTGRVGCYFNKQRGKWRSQAMISGKRFFLGDYDNEEDAKAAYAAFLSTYPVTVL